MKSKLLSIAGVVVFAFGLLFALQGGGVVRWPAESSMLGQRDWIERGIFFALIGLGMIAAARRIR